ncbi:MAG: Uma2 family endonuclease [Chloroflexota bacterium]|nr:Uma2 family endonuclease [Chloroflexota bacterium]MDE2895345.1 Uma2 family endonuclease [Chloroflexota bacterium]
MTTTAPVAAHPLPGMIRLGCGLGAISDEDLERICNDNPGWQIEIDAEEALVINARPYGVVPDVCTEIGAQVGNWRVSGGGGRARDSSAGYRMTDADGRTRLLEPDVSWVSPERLATATREDVRGAMSFNPDFVVEIRSPSDRLRDQQTKMDIWMHYGVRLGWLVDLDSCNVWIYRPDQDPQLLERPATLDGEDVLVGLEVNCAEIWRLADEANQSALPSPPGRGSG